MPRLQPFELEVLVAAVRLGDQAYSVPIVLILEKDSGRPVSQAAVFIALQRLEKKGLMSSRLDERASRDSARVRRYFKPTRQALRLLKETRRRHEQLWDGLDRLLDKA